MTCANFPKGTNKGYIIIIISDLAYFCTDWYQVQQIVGHKVGVGVGEGVRFGVGLGVSLGAAVGVGVGVGVGV